MHGLTGGSWKRSRHSVTPTEKNNLTRNRVVPNGSVVYNRTTPPRQFPTLLRYGHSARRFSKIRTYAWTRLAHYISERHGRARGFGSWVLTDQRVNDLGLISMSGIVVPPRPFKDWRIRPNAGGERRR
jgi:hypothetical protein